MLVADVTERAQGWWFPVGILTVFLFVGLYMFLGRFLVDARKRSRRFYAVTNERVIILSAGSSTVVKSLNLDTLSDITMTERSNGSGVISFGPWSSMLLGYTGWGWPGTNADLISMLEPQQGIRELYETIIKARRALQS